MQSKSMGRQIREGPLRNCTTTVIAYAKRSARCRPDWIRATSMRISANVSTPSARRDRVPEG